jgi:hypothetical protein
VIDALEHDMGSTLATKQDIQLLEQKLGQQLELRSLATQQDIRLLEQKLELMQSSMTIRLGSILVVAMGLLFAALKLT